MSKLSRILAPLALAAAVIAPSLAHAGTTPTDATVAAKSGTSAIAKWGRGERYRVRGPAIVVRPPVPVVAPVYAPPPVVQPVYAPPAVRVVPGYVYRPRFEYGRRYGWRSGYGRRW